MTKNAMAGAREEIQGNAEDHTPHKMEGSCHQTSDIPVMGGAPSGFLDGEPTAAVAPPTKGQKP